MAPRQRKVLKCLLSHQKPHTTLCSSSTFHPKANCLHQLSGPGSAASSAGQASVSLTTPRLRRLRCHFPQSSYLPPSHPTLPFKKLCLRFRFKNLRLYCFTWILSFVLFLSQLFMLWLLIIKCGILLFNKFLIKYCRLGKHSLKARPVYNGSFLSILYLLLSRASPEQLFTG